MTVHLKLLQRDKWHHLPGSGIGSGRKLTETIGPRKLRLVTRDETTPPPYWRPKTRGDCAQVERPCPFIGCSANLYLDVTDAGSLRLNFPDLAPDQMPADASCALDLAERHDGMTLDEAGAACGVTRERVRQIEAVALRKLANSAKARRVVGR